MTKVINFPGRAHSTEVGNVLTGANEILDDVKGKKQDVINSETYAELLRLENEKQDVLTFDNTPTDGSNNPVKSDGVYAADKALSDAIGAILLLIPSAATALNQLADKAFVNSSVSTATATFRGTYNVVTDLELAYNVTHEQIAAKLGTVILTADNNDYAYVQIPVSESSTDIEHTERYKFNGTAWAYEYDLNTSGFTAAQWEAINSTITTVLVQKLAALPTAEELAIALSGKQDNLTFDNTPTIGSNNPVKSGGIKSAINDEKTARENADGLINQNIQSILNIIPTGATSSNKLVDVAGMTAAISVISAVIGDLDATFNIVSTDGHITLHVTQENGLITSVEVQSTDIASAADLTLLTNRMTTAEGNINTLTENVSSLDGRVGINERNIAYLQQLYNSLQQCKPVPVTALPETGQQQGVIYRLAGTTSYSDYMWNGSDWVLMATYSNAIDPRPKKGSENLVTSGGVFDNMGALDISELNATENPHTLATYADLSAALAAIPSDDYKKGGMSVKFVLSSDNKYVQFRLMAQSFTTDTTQWAICDDSVLVECPEYVAVYTDTDGKIIIAVENDGSIHFGAGVPQQVIDYIEEKIADLSLDEYEDIVAFLNGLEEGDKTLQTLLNEKVDKEEGKSLIDANYASSQSAIESPEFIEVTTDSEDKVLEGIQQDGTKVFGVDLNVGGSAKILGNMEVSGVSYKVIENPEYLAAWVDAKDKILFGLKTNGKTYVGDADFLNNIDEIKDILLNTIRYTNIDWDALKSIKTAENPEYINVEVDSEDKILSGRKTNGTKVENIGFETPKINIGGTSVDYIDDAEERIELKTDSEKRVISYRDENGILHEMAGISTPNLILDILGKTNISSYDLRLPQVRVYSKGLIVNGDTIIGLTTSKNEVDCTYVFLSNDLKFVDSGNIAYQGNSSLLNRKKGFSFNFSNKHRFGDWLEMDEYHGKGYFGDWMHFRDIACAKILEWFYSCRDFDKNKPFKKYNNFLEWRAYNKQSTDSVAGYVASVSDLENISANERDIYGIGTVETATEFYRYESLNMATLSESGALCHIDGFPIELYINDTYWGLYSINIKKERSNYILTKTDTAHIQVEAANDTYYTDESFADGGAGWAAIELRNPKPKKKKDGWEVVDMNGDTYAEGAELISPSSGEYDATKESHVKSYAIKQSWQSFIHQLNQVTSETTIEELSEFLDVEEWVDTILFCQLVYHVDSWCKNHLYTTWDNTHWSPLLYDFDACLGVGRNPVTGEIIGMGNAAVQDIVNDKGHQIYCSTWLPTIHTLLGSRIAARYAELRSSGALTYKRYEDLLLSWERHIGKDVYNDDDERWSYPSLGHNGCYLLTTKDLLDWFKNRIDALDVKYNYNN